MKRFAQLLIAMLLASSVRASAQTYTYVDLGVVPYTDTFGTSASNAQQVGYGLVGGQPQALLWQNTSASATPLPSTGYSSSRALGIAGSFAAGSGVTPGNQTVALLWNGLTQQPVNLNPSWANSSVANGIAFQPFRQVGAATLTSTGQQVAVAWNGTAGSATNINPSGASSSQALATAAFIYQAGSAVFSGVTHAIFWNGASASSAVDLHPSGALRSEALGIGADLGSTPNQVEVGDYTTSTGAVHACLWLGTAASMVDLHLYLGSGYTSSTVLGAMGGSDGNGGIAVVAVGYGTNTAGTTVPILWLWRKNGGQNYTDLSSYMPPGTTGARLVAIDPSYNNNAYTMLGYATINGSNHAFILGPSIYPLFISKAQALSTVVGLPYTYTVATRSFPSPTYAASGLASAGLTISPATGVISGTPTTTGTFTGTIGATSIFNGTQHSMGQNFTINVVNSPLLQASIVGNLAPANGTGLHQSMVLGNDGNFYGTSTTGGAGSGGTVYEMTPAGTETTIHAFGDGSVQNDGAQPMGLSFGSDGVTLYGTTLNGGSAGLGTAFQIAQGMTSILHNFGDGSVPKDGANPATSLLQATDGNFYSVTKGGGAYGQGTYFSMTPSGSVSVRYSFDSSVTNDQSSPDCPLVQDPNFGTPTFYGTIKTETSLSGTGGRGIAVAANWNGPEYILKAFDAGVPPFLGCRPHGPLAINQIDQLYGIASAGGTSSNYFSSDPTNPNVFGLGTIYSLTTSGTQTDLHNFGDGTVGNDGCNTAEPTAPLVQGLDGNFYGVTPAGGSANQGCFFQITPTGTMLVLHSFGDGTLANDGMDPGPVLFRGPDGYSFYGVTQKGGAYGNGAIYKFVVGVAPAFPVQGRRPLLYVGLPFSYTYTASGFPSPTFSVTSGKLPAGLTLSPSGLLSGTPTTAGSSGSVTITASNGIATAATLRTIFLVNASSAPAITNGPPPATGTVGVAYLFNYLYSGDPSPTFSVTAGSLPAGLTLSPDGTISGTPTTAGIYTGTITADNGLSPAATQNFTITVTSTYSGWVTQEGLTGNNALPMAVVSPDSIDNQIKYALGLNPFATYSPGSAGLPSVQVQNVAGTNYLALTFTGVATDVTYTVQATSNLPGGWTNIQTFPSGGTAPGTVTVQDTQDVTVSPRRYMRLITTIP